MKNFPRSGIPLCGKKLSMNKSSLLSDTFEEFIELGKSTAQKTGQTVKTLTVGTVKKTGEAVVGSLSQDDVLSKQESQKTKTNFTPLDKNRLDKQYQNQNAEKINAVRQELYRFLERQKQEEKKAVEERKQKETERKKTLEEEEIQKKKQQEAKTQSVSLPKGKERKSIFSAKKIAKRSQMETRADSGKQ